MAKRRQRHDIGGPWIATAVFCEKVLHEADGVSSLIRIVDRYTLTVQGDNPLPAISPIAAITIKSGFARGTYALSIAGVSPSGVQMPEARVQVLFEGDDRGIAVNAQMNILNPEEGLYWFDVLAEGVRLTKMPLRVLVQRQQVFGQAHQP
jgi:hypothetical protein